MRFDLEWLQEQLVDGPDGDALAEKLTACGFNVELREPDGGSEIWDVDVTTNRPDAMNHRGLAREAAVATGAVLRPLTIELEESGDAAADLVAVEIERPELCGRYVARVIRGARPVPSPEWLRRRLERCGVRPINAIVDATNFVLLELGQPLHAFDLARIGGGKIVVRPARKGEELRTLDGEARALDPSVLVIADERRAVALAGIMGGADTEIDDTTQDVLLESAHFDALTIRRAARKLGMHTEASHRFERGADIGMAPVAADLAAALITRLAGGTVAAGRIDVHPAPDVGQKVGLSVRALSDFAGLEIAPGEAVRILEGLGFRPRQDGDRVTATVPSWRVDVERVQDLYEEIIRHVGYDAVPSRLPVLATDPGERHPAWQLIDRARDAAVAEGLAEIMTWAFIAPDEDEMAPPPLSADQPLPLANPLAQTQSVMRRSLLPGLVAAARTSLNQGETALALFEEGRVFGVSDGEPVERERLAILLSGPVGNWQVREAVGLTHLKGIVESLVERIGFPPLAWQRGGAPWLDEAEGAVLVGEDGTSLGIAGLLAGAVAGRWDIRQPVYVAELDLDAAEAPQAPRFEPLPRFPAVTADMTVEHEQSLAYADLLEAVHGLASELVAGVELAARFAGKGIPEGKVRTTLRLVYRHRERSLTQDEVNAAQESLRERLAEALKITFA